MSLVNEVEKHFLLPYPFCFIQLISFLSLTLFPVFFFFQLSFWLFLFLHSALSEEEKTLLRAGLITNFNEPVNQVSSRMACRRVTFHSWLQILFNKNLRKLCFNNSVSVNWRSKLYIYFHGKFVNVSRLRTTTTGSLAVRLMRVLWNWIQSSFSSNAAVSWCTCWTECQCWATAGPSSICVIPFSVRKTEHCCESFLRKIKNSKCVSCHASYIRATNQCHKKNCSLLSWSCPRLPHGESPP